MGRKIAHSLTLHHFVNAYEISALFLPPSLKLLITPSIMRVEEWKLSDPYRDQDLPIIL
jgi:hypothetical protein